MVQFLVNGPEEAAQALILAHGAGAAMDSPFMNAIAEGLGEQGITVFRFEFAYMAERRKGGPKRPPSSQGRLIGEWREAVGEVAAQRPVSAVAIGGKSLGGRVASMIADDVRAAGLVCLGYPFHPPSKPDVLRTRHLERLTTPTLIVQGTRDPFGNREEVGSYVLSPAIRFHWAEDGDHGLKPRKASGRTEDQNLTEAVRRIARFLVSSNRNSLENRPS
jgi:predicted alpha/beta-hydrolase family hydrolase